MGRARLFLGLFLCAALSACAYTIGEDALDVDEFGTPIDATQQDFIPNLLKDIRLLVGPDGTPWLAEPTGLLPTDDLTMPDPRGGLAGSYFMHRLDGKTGTPNGYVVPTQKLSLFPAAPAQSICAYRDSADPTNPFFASFRRADQQSVIEYPTGPLEPLVLCGQRTMAYYQPANDNLYIDLLRRGDDGQLTHRRLPWPFEARVDLFQGPLGFDDQEQVLFVTDGDYRTLVHYLDTAEVIDLGVLYWGQSLAGSFIYIDLDGYLYVYHLAQRLRQPLGFRLGPSGQIIGMSVARQEIVTCDWDGLRAVSVPQPSDVPPVIAPQHILDKTPCTASSSQLPAITSLILYTPDIDPPGSETRSVRIDTPAPPKVLYRQSASDDAPRVLGVCQDLAVPYTLDSPDRYGPSVNDGWLGSYRFMERGREVRFAPDCSRLYFKEFAANVRRLGELRVAGVPPTLDVDADNLPVPKRLGRNVGFYRVVPDGRVLAMVDLAVVGPQNRLLIIDDKPQAARGVAQALVHSLNSVTGAMFLDSYLPGRREIILEVKDTDPGRKSGLLIVTPPPPADDAPPVPPG